VAVQDDIQGKREAERFDLACCRDLPLVGRCAGNVVGERRVGGLDADLHVIETGSLQLLGLCRGQRERARDEIAVEAECACAGDDLGEITALQWLASGEVEL